MSVNKINIIVIVIIATLLTHVTHAQNQAPLTPLPLQQNLVMQKALPTEKAPRPTPVNLLQSSTENYDNATASFFGRTFFGALVNSTDWATASIAQVPYGIYSFDISDNIEDERHISDLSYSFLSGAFDGKDFFGITALNVMGAFNGARYITIDTENWSEKKNVLYDPSQGYYSLISSTMAYNYIDNTIYSMQYNEALSGLNWCTYNAEYNTMDKIATFRGKYNVLTLATVPNGDMYFINGYGDLYKVNKQTGRPTLIGWTGTFPTLYSQSMVYDNRTGKFLWAAITDAGSLLLSVDPETAETTFVTKFLKNEQYVALYSLEESAKDKAPAKVQDLSLDFDANGSLTGIISFSIPTTTYSGAALGNTNLNVWLDGEKIKEVDINAGEKVFIPVSLTEGNHYVAVNLKNAEGWSPLASLHQYAGYDIPLAVTDLKFENTSLGENIISWTAPKGGVNKGYVDQDRLTYNIVRMPDNVSVATNLSSTSFTEAMPSAMHNYSYRVYAVNNGVNGEIAESNAIICGKAYEMPYSQSFADANALAEYFTVIDANGDGNTWRVGYGNDIRIDINAHNNPEGDDWLITPALSLQGNNRYRYTVNLKTYIKGYPETIEVLIGTDPTDMTTFTSIVKEESLEIYEIFDDYNVDFNIETDGNYYIALRYLSDSAKNGSMLLIKNISVSHIGASKAPASGHNFRIIPDADDAMKATLEFISPDKDLTGSSITTLTKINVYRNGSDAPIYVFERPSINTQLTWTDAQVDKMGMNTYSVRAENEYGIGEAMIDSAFIGVYQAPYEESFDTRSASQYYTTSIEGIDQDIYASYQWKYDEYNKNMNLYAFIGQPDQYASAWIYTPMIKLDANSVYQFTYKKNFLAFTESISHKLYLGTDTVPQSQTTLLGDIPLNETYGMEEATNRVVIRTGGKYCFGFNSTASAQYDNLMGTLDDISLTYVKSAFSPYIITDFSATASNTGSHSAELAFKAPAINYHDERLTDELSIEIYRNNGSIPVYTKEGVIPGSEVKWSDTQAQQGQNTYIVITTNKYGRSEAYSESLFVGFDRPSSVNAFSLKGSADNCAAEMTWEAPTTGHNGGVIRSSDLLYRIMQYDPTDGTFFIIADDVKELKYTAIKKDADQQEVLYYGVAAKTSEGIGDTIVASCTIGKPYKVPFKESFSEKQLTTSPWIIGTQNSYILNWGVADPSGEGYNNAIPQDEDGGCAYFYNGSYYETYAGASFISPKITMEGTANKLSFWVYNYAAKYTQLPYLLLFINVDDTDFVEVARFVVSTEDGSEGWKKYEIDLDQYKDSHYISFAFSAYTGGYQECIYLDNIQINDASTGFSKIENENKTVDHINWYDLSGREVICPKEQNVYIKTITYTDGTQISTKVMKE